MELTPNGTALGRHPSSRRCLEHSEKTWPVGRGLPRRRGSPRRHPHLDRASRPSRTAAIRRADDVDAVRRDPL